mmetsp:Transcript_36403/g.36653  ORF Transcript_36403/g.36653 Transcript_36403/m.36653 type:complete len:89 (+) Transcript_36403:1107-1373(+)
MGPVLLRGSIIICGVGESEGEIVGWWVGNSVGTRVGVTVGTCDGGCAVVQRHAPHTEGISSATNIQASASDLLPPTTVCFQFMRAAHE